MKVRSLGLFAALTLLPIAACESEAQPLPDTVERHETEVLFGTEPWVIDVRELTGATGDFDIEVTSTGGMAAVDGESVVFTPDPALYFTRTHLHVVATGADETRVHVRFDIASLPDSLEFRPFVGVSLPTYESSAIAFGGNEPADGFADHVYEAGDFDGNGYPDVLVVAPFANLPFTDQGAIYLLRGSESGVSGPHLVAEGAPGDLLGLNPRPGDVDGDGVTDIVFDSRGDDGERHAVLFGGDLDDLEPVAIPSAQDDSPWNTTLADLDGDGRSDLLVMRQGGEGWNGYLATGDRSQPFESQPGITFVCPGDDSFGRADSVGNIDGEGGDDIALRCGASDLSIVDGRNGQPLVSMDRDTSLVPLPDMNGDGVGELWVQAFDSDGYIALTGLDSLAGGCNRERRWKVPGSNVKVVPDIDGDGMLDVMSTDWTLQREGISLSGQRSCAAPEPGAAFDMDVDMLLDSAFIQDFDQDGRAELVSASRANEGHVFVQEFPAAPAPVDEAEEAEEPEEQ